MKTSIARQYLLRALRMKRKRSREIEIRERVRNGLCIIDGCDKPFVARGLCDKHRQMWYQQVRSQDSPESRVEFEERAIQLGLILAPNEQREWTKDNPFAEAAG